MTYPIIEVPEGASSQLEQLGTKSKFWYRDQDNKRILFKRGRPGTGENWAEKCVVRFAIYWGFHTLSMTLPPLATGRE